MNAASFVGPAGTGHWTVIPSGHEGNTYRAVTLAPGQVLSGQDFAWYQYSGPTPTPVASLTPTPSGFFFLPGINANCRLGPDLIFGVLDVAMKGTSYPIDGRNAEDTWLRIMLNPNRGCWVFGTSGTASGDTSGVRVLISPPTPTPTAVIDCTAFKDQRTCEAHPVCQWKQSPSAGAVIYTCVSK